MSIPDPYADVVNTLTSALSRQQLITDWAPDEAGQILAGALVRTETETRTNKATDETFTVDTLVLDAYHGDRHRIQVRGRGFKAWFGANSFALKPGVILAVRYDGLADGKWSEYTAVPDSRDGGEFIVAPGQPGEDPEGFPPEEPPF